MVTGDEIKMWLNSREGSLRGVTGVSTQAQWMENAILSNKKQVSEEVT